MKKVIRASIQSTKIESAYNRAAKIYSQHKKLIDRLRSK